MEGRFLSMILVPNREAIAKLQKAAREAEAAAREAAAAAQPPQGGVKMPKMKTHRGAAKRFKKHRHAARSCTRSSNRRHILTKKTRKRKRQLREKNVLSPGDQKRLDQLVPYL